jgi:hypothetical protein
LVGYVSSDAVLDTSVTKTLVEKRLGLMDSIPGMDPSLNLAIATTKGQGDHMRILNDPEAWVARKLRRSTITYWLRYILIALAGVDLCGAATSILMMIYALGNRQALRLLRVALFSN